LELLQLEVPAEVTPGKSRERSPRVWRQPSAAGPSTRWRDPGEKSGTPKSYQKRRL